MPSVSVAAAIKITNGVSKSMRYLWRMEAIAAAEIDGVNTVLWKKTANRLHTWISIAIGTTSVARTGSIPIPMLLLPLKPTSTSISMVMEPLAVYSTVNTTGSVAFQASEQGFMPSLSVAAAQSRSPKGKQIYDGIYGGWETLAAAEIDGVNTVLWKKLPTACTLGGSIAIGTTSVARTGSIPIPVLLLPLKPTSTSISMVMEPLACYSTINTTGSVAFQKASKRALCRLYQWRQPNQDHQ